LLNLVNQLLDFKKLEEHELQLNLTEGEFVSFVYDVAESFRDLAGGKKIKYQIICPDKKVFVRYDADKIERVLFNLLSNAFKFTPAGGSVEVKLTELAFDREAHIHRLRLQVSDTGIGLSENDKLHVFDRFYQAGGPAAIINQGSGIGLSITKDLILLHGGKIELESEPGKGAVFSVMLDLVAIDTVNEAHEVPATRQTVVTPSKLLAGPLGLQTGTDLPHVLIVEDNDELRYYIAENLRPQYQVSEAVDGRDAWNKILSGHPDIVVSDITMPFMDGISLSKKLKADKRTSHIPIILLTALNGQEHQVAGLESGATDYLTKPFNFDILSIKIRNLLALNRRFKETYQKQIKVSPTEKEFESGSEKFINNLVVYIEQNLTNSNFSVGDLSEHFGMSRGSLYSKIMEITGKSPIDFIREIKLANAATLLEKSEMTISEVAYSSGFSTPHYFAKSFKTKYHVLPSEYRAKKMNGVSKHTHS
jgi:DNA-binding response OmpR family regulator/two-component sensor histidine kinase